MVQSGFNRDLSGDLFCDEVSIESISKEYGTPCYIYSASMIRSNYERFRGAFEGIETLVCYSIKSCSNLSICQLLMEAGSGFDVVSGGELERVKRINADPKKVVFAGVGKTNNEISEAIDMGILAFTVESFPELERIGKIASEKGVQAPVAIRVNPDVDPKTHVYISTGKSENKFGMDLEVAKKAFHMAHEHPSIDVVGLHMHIGSQLVQVDPYLEAINRIKSFVEYLKEQKIIIQFIDIGGGIGIVYDDEKPEGPEDLAPLIKPFFKEWGSTLLLEPGRFIVGNAGMMITEVQYVKYGPIKTFVIVDAGMNDLLRPSLYSAYHRIEPVTNLEGTKEKVDIVGPVCESGDFFGKDRMIRKMNQGDLISIHSTGAYGFTMASHYNTRPKPVEILVDGSNVQIIKHRENVDQLLEDEISCLKKSLL